MGAKKNKIHCIIPAFNEQASIGRVIDEVLPYVDELIVVNDGSTDKTARIVRSKQAVLLNHPVNRGQGAALQTGNQYSLSKDADIIVHFDADGQFLAEEIPDILKPLINKEADIVFGSRFLDKKSDIPKLKKYIIFPLAKAVNWLVMGKNLSDPQNGFRAMNRKAALMIVIEQDDMAHCSEIIHKAFKYELRIAEVPITVIYKNYGQRFGHGFRILADLIIAKLTK